MSPRVVQKPQESAEQRRQELVEANARLDEAERLRQVVANMREDVVREEAKRDQLAAIGAGHVEIPQRSFDQRFRVEIEWTPIRSRLSGAELAAELEATIVPLRAEVKAIETRIEELG